MKPIFSFMAIVWVLCNFPLRSADHCVRQGATGNNDGSDWANAFTELPQTLIRGDRYYVADGQYCPNGYIIDDPVNGQLYIRILKAIPSVHGPDGGWNDAYGDGQAIFTEQLDIRTSFIVFDGVIGGEPLAGSLFPDPTGYGFSVVPNSAHGQEHTLIMAPHSGDIDYVQISHCLLINAGYEWDNGVEGQFCIYIGPDHATDHYTISHNYMSNADTLLLIYNSSHSVVEHNYFMENWSSPYNHGQLVAPGWNSDDVIFRNNVFYLPTPFVFGTHESGDLVDNGRNGPSERWQVYNNIIIGDGSDVVNAGFANAESATPNSILNSDFHHNIFYNFDFRRGAIFIGTVSPELVEGGKSRVYNNIFYKVQDVDLSGAGYTPGILIHGHNDYYDCTGRMYPGATDNVYTGIDPFVNSAQFDFRLKGQTQAGTSLPSPYNVDYAGKLRGLDGNWDRGAYEYAPALTITSPNGGELWLKGHQRSISWTASGLTDPLTIEIIQNGSVLGTVATGINDAAGSYNWTVGRLANGSYISGQNLKIRVRTANGQMLTEQEMN